jgi:hypothetical protein
MQQRSSPLVFGLCVLIGACAHGGARSRHGTAGADSAPTLAKAAAACRRLQDEHTIPVGCTTREVEGVPSMFIAFAERQAADRHLPHVASVVAGPFCDAANSSNRPASVYVAIQSWAKRYNCELGQWGEWFSFHGNLAALGQPGSTARSPRSVEAAVADAVDRCRRVQESASIPVACKLQYLNKIPSMVIGFRNEQEAAEFMRPMAENVAGPFCDAANDSGQTAAVAVVVGRTTARLFDCENGRWGEWFSLDGDAGDDETAPRERSAEILL